eukprot:TRINITY_DN2186_c0_g1_i1.p1 TRINITY_DN2186_c0_g1~~TRINITY_DN2186_c0_g1_i1.p1  ORF type:complete len:265 (-),score=77.21 TRINITY_DN2186_c0_g1_i1:224-964(-)
MTTPPPAKQLITTDSSIRLVERKEKKDQVYFVFEVRIRRETWHIMRLLSQIESLRDMLELKYSEIIALPELNPPPVEGFFNWLTSGISEEQQREQEKTRLQEFVHYIFQSDILRNDEATLNFLKPIRELSENEEHLEITIRSVKYAHNNLLDPYQPTDVLDPSIYFHSEEQQESASPSQQDAGAPSSPTGRRKSVRQYTEDDIARMRGIMKTMSTEKISRRKRTESQENLFNVTRAKLYAAVGAPE